ncbi:hypothetical protein BC936DRAFT_145303 [Jimgerdemannia flammicorona]|uniref:Uncharacterized protein n=1 Tax=Jimgerdemannia flammicorona TaxID=994334 RepID=A0A433DAE4_9FUNG|nr:hypothetical protein BC936DRAFT_145303 [Jimgerdemannia flammicorona]
MPLPEVAETRNVTLSFSKMENSFAKLLRASRLASFDPAIPQVYTSRGRSMAIGDWGLKRNLPTVIRTNVLTIQALDTTEHQTPWRSAQDSTLFLKRWKENFPASKTPAPRSSTLPHNLATMSEGEWKHFLTQAAARKKKWRLNKSKDATNAELLTFLNATSTADHTIVGPTYSAVSNPEPWQVQGRVLNINIPGSGYVGYSSYNVGIAGVVASMQRNSYFARNRELQKFNVQRAEIDLQTGKPSVTVLLSQTTEKNDTFMAPDNPRMTFFDGNDAVLSADAIFATERKPIRNGTHETIMDKIVDLMRADDDLGVKEERKTKYTKHTEADDDLGVKEMRKTNYTSVLGRMKSSRD